jgi:hypothetical protein
MVPAHAPAAPPGLHVLNKTLTGNSILSLIASVMKALTCDILLSTIALR